MKTKERIIAILVNNKPDVLARIAGTFSQRGFNIESISANITRDPQITKIILTTRGDQDTIIKIEKQLNNLVDIIEVNDLTKVKSTVREMVLMRLMVDEKNQPRILQAVTSLGGKVVSKEAGHWVVEATGDADEIEQILAKFAPLGIEDITRTGIVALEQENP